MAFIKKIIVIYFANIFDFLLYHLALQTTVIVVLRGAKEHRRMKVYRNQKLISILLFIDFRKAFDIPKAYVNQQGS